MTALGSSIYMFGGCVPYLSCYRTFDVFVPASRHTQTGRCLPKLWGTRRYGISPQQEGYEITPQEGDEPMALHMSDLYVLKAGALTDRTSLVFVFTSARLR